MPTHQQSNAPEYVRAATVSFMDAFCRSDLTDADITNISCFLETLGEYGWDHAFSVLALARQASSRPFHPAGAEELVALPIRKTQFTLSELYSALVKKHS